MTAPALVSSNTTVATMKMLELDAHVSPLQIHVEIHSLQEMKDCNVKYTRKSLHYRLNYPSWVASMIMYVCMYNNIHMWICTYTICMS